MIPRGTYYQPDDDKDKRIEELEAQVEHLKPAVKELLARGRELAELQRKYDALVAEIESTAEYLERNDSEYEASLLRALLGDDDE